MDCPFIPPIEEIFCGQFTRFLSGIRVNLRSFTGIELDLRDLRWIMVDLIR